MNVPIADIRPNIANATKVQDWHRALIDPAATEKLRKSNPGIVDLFEDIRERGILNPIICYGITNGSYVVAVGHQRLACAKALGMETMEVERIRERSEIPGIMAGYVE